MTIAIVRGVEITRPTPDPLTSSVLDHATVVENTHFGLRNNEGLWPSYNCLDTLVPTALCQEPVATKVFSKAGWVPGFEFAIYGGVECKAVGLDRADQEREIARVFSLNEGKGVEQALLLNRFVATDSDMPVQWDAPVDLTPGSDIDPRTALALLEGYAASVYAGLPTIHMPRAAASYLGERIVWKGDKAYTRMGSKVAIGGGYDTDEPSDGTWDLFATGEVYVERSGTVNVNTIVIPGDGSGTGSDENGLSDNTVIGLAERMFRVGVDCFVAKATSTVAAVSGGGFGV